MSREEKRASDEKEMKLACDELVGFGAIYRFPENGETPQKRASRKQTIKRSIAAAKKRRGITTKRKKNFGEIVNASGYPTTIPTIVKMRRQEERGSVPLSWRRKRCNWNVIRVKWSMCLTPMVRIPMAVEEGSENR